MPELTSSAIFSRFVHGIMISSLLINFLNVPPSTYSANKTGKL